MVAAVPTRYQGTLFRSRLEARWAAFFDRIDWPWEYEPHDGDGYIPDFAILGDRPLIVEVKPGLTMDDLTPHRAKMERGLRDGLQHDALIVGSTPCPRGPSDLQGLPVAGPMAEVGQAPAGDHFYAWGTAAWSRCATCGELAVLHEDMSWAMRPCGHYNGDDIGGASEASLLAHWTKARNVTQWVPQRQ